jgi:hypothetical protein
MGTRIVRRRHTGRIEHRGFAGLKAAAANHYQGWLRVIAWMQAFVEKGETVATRTAAAPADDK